jgi:hypothetical protein
MNQVQVNVVEDLSDRANIQLSFLAVLMLLVAYTHIYSSALMCHFR